MTILSAQKILKTYSNSLCARKGLAGDYDDHGDADGGSHCGIRYGDGELVMVMVMVIMAMVIMMVKMMMVGWWTVVSSPKD